MQRILLALVGLALLATCTAASDVTILTPDNFDSVVGKDQGVFVEFFAPWCGHCKSLAPEYELVATAFSKLSSQAVIASVDADAHRSLGSRFEVKGFPTLKWFPAGSLTGETYSGGRTAQAIVDFVNSKAGTNAKLVTKPTAVVELTDADFDAIVKDDTKDVLVEFYAPWCGHCKKLTPDYEAAAASVAGESSLVVAKIDADKYREVGTKYGVTGFPTIKYFPKGNKAGEEYSGGRSPSDFVKFFNEKAGTERVLGGGYLESAGRIAALDELASEFASSTDAEARTGVVAKIHTAVAAAKEETAKFYKLAADNVHKSTEWASKEIERLTRMLKGNVTPKARGALSKRINIVKQFLAKA